MKAVSLHLPTSARELFVLADVAPSETTRPSNEPPTAESVALSEVELAADADSFNGKPLLQLPGDDSMLSVFDEKLGRLLRDHGIYQRGGLAVTINSGRCTPVDFAVMPSSVEDFVVTFTFKEREGVKRRVIRSMTTATARGTFKAPKFLNELKPLKFVAPARMPIRRASGAIEMLPLGYDAESGIFTSPDSPDFQTDMPVEDAVHFIDELLAEFPFVQDVGRSKAVAIAAMLTVFAEGILDPNAEKPTIIYTANSEGSGKTVLAKLAGIPFGVTTVTTPPTNEGEWKKTLLSFVIGAARVVIFDNCKGHLDSAALEAYLTSSQFEGRILGRSKIYRGESGSTVLITGNGLTVSPDLRRRSLFVELFAEELRPEEKVFKETLDQAELLRLRPRVLGALFAMVRAWDEAGRPEGTVDHASFPRWAKTIGGIMEYAGYANPCSRPEINGMGDTDARDLENLARCMKPGTRYEFREIATICVREGFFEEATAERDGFFLSRKGNSTLGRKLQRYDRKLVAPSLRFVIQGKGHARRYCLVDAGQHGQHGQHGLPAQTTANSPAEPLIAEIPAGFFTPAQWGGHDRTDQSQPIQNSEPVAAPKATSTRPRLTGAVGFNTLNQSVIT